MPVSLTFENDGAGVVLTAVGELTGAEVFEANQNIYTPEIMRSLRYQIFDLSGLDRVHASADTIRKLAEQDRAAAEESPGLCIAIVADHYFLQSLAHLWKSYVQGSAVQARVFSCLAEARAWIEEIRIAESAATHF